MPNVGPAELLVIFVVALLVFGPDKLPEMGKQVGRAVREFRRWQTDIRDELRDIVDPPVDTTSAKPPTLPPAYDALEEPEPPEGEGEAGPTPDDDADDH